MHVVASAKPSCDEIGAVRVALLFLALVAVPAAYADSLLVAVASNFRLPAEAIAAQFTAQTGHDVTLSSASTGKLYAQIVNGAPFAVLLAADSERPRLLEEAGLGAAGTRRTYAVGHLVLWSRDAAFADTDCRARLDDLGKHRLAIANTVTAPYGLAAKQFLENTGSWERVSGRLVYGESIAQTLHFVASGNASLGLIAASQALDDRLPPATCSWRVPTDLYDPIQQQAIAIASAGDVATEFVEFLDSPAAREIVARFGYGVAQ